MRRLMKLLFIFIVIFTANQTVFAKQLESDALRANVIKRLPKLNHTKLQALMKRVGRDVPKGYYQCLCNSYTTMGNGIGYSANGTGGNCENAPYPCIGGNWGCVYYPLPSDPKVIEHCMKSAKYNDDSMIIDVIEKALDSKLAGGTTPLAMLPKMSSQEKELMKRNIAYKNACLPSLLDKTDFTNAVKVLEIIKESDNICEEAVAANLFLSSKKAKTTAGIMLKVFAIWVMPNSFDKADYVNTGVATINQNYASSIMKNVLGRALGAAGSIKNLYDTAELYKTEKSNIRTDVYYKEAFDLFRKSKNWTASKITEKIKQIQTDIFLARDKIIKAEEIYKKQRSFALAEATNAAGGGGIKLDLYFKDNPAIKQKYDAKEKKQSKAANDKKIKLLYRLENLMLKQRIMEDYREPFSTEGCEKYLAKREQACKKRLADEAHQAEERGRREAIEAKERKRRLQYPISGGGTISGVDATRPKTGKKQINPLGGIPGSVINPQR